MTADRTIRLAGARGMIAAKMVRSLQTAAQLSFHAECDATDLLALRSQFKAEGRDASVEDLLILALVRALRAHPGLNGHVLDDRIELRRAINVATAIALPNSLVAPCLFDVGDMGLAGIASARADLVARARAGRLHVSEMTEGTITLSNLGQSRVSFFTPILNMPQIAVLGVGCIREQAAGLGRPTLRAMIGLSLTVDHRAVDGAPAAAFLSALCEEIEGIAAHADE